MTAFTSEQALWAASLWEHLRCAVGFARAGGGALQQAEIARSRRYLKSRGAEACAASIGIDPDWWREKIREFDAAGWPVDQVLRVTPNRRNQYSPKKP
nr:hypothetical protein [uncultured Ruegeria sp.]